MATNFTTNAAIDAYYRGQKEPVNAQITQAGNDYQAAIDRLKALKEQQDAENYRSYVRQGQEIPGLMRASGNTGGMVDSAVASLANAYNQARAKRGLEYEANVASQGADYNGRLAELRAQLAKYDQMANADKSQLAADMAAQEEARRAAAAASRRRVAEEETKTGIDASDDWAKRDVTGQDLYNMGTMAKELPVAKRTDSVLNSNDTTRLRNVPMEYEEAPSSSGVANNTTKSSQKTMRDTGFTSRRLPSVKA